MPKSPRRERRRHDPLGHLYRHGWRLCWLRDNDRSIIVVPDHHIIIADPVLTRQEIADLAWEWAPAA